MIRNIEGIFDVLKYVLEERYSSVNKLNYAAAKEEYVRNKEALQRGADKNKHLLSKILYNLYKTVLEVKVRGYEGDTSAKQDGRSDNHLGKRFFKETTSLTRMVFQSLDASPMVCTSPAALAIEEVVKFLWNVDVIEGRYGYASVSINCNDVSMFLDKAIIAFQEVKDKLDKCIVYSNMNMRLGEQIEIKDVSYVKVRKDIPRRVPVFDVESEYMMLAEKMGLEHFARLIHILAIDSVLTFRTPHAD